MFGKSNWARAAAALFCIFALTVSARASADDAVATVNGESISTTEFFERVQRVNVRDFIVTMQPLTVRSQTAGQILLDQIINERLTFQWASKTNQMPADADVTAELAKVKLQPGIQQALATHQVS